MTSVDEDCAKDEEKVDENPAGEGRYALGHLSYQGILKFYAFVAVKYNLSIYHTLNTVKQSQCNVIDQIVLIQFLTALAALYLTLVSESVRECYFRILTQRVTFETCDPSDI